MKGFAKPLASARDRARARPRSRPTKPHDQDTVRTVRPAKAAPAYYCSATRTIYWPVSADDGNEAYTFARLGYVGPVAHEFGHHMQAASGMLREYGQRSAVKSLGRALSAEPSARAAGAVLRGRLPGNDLHDAHSSEQNDRYQAPASGTAYTGDEDPPAGRKPDHGTSAAQIRWLYRGLDSGDFGRCNTWTAQEIRQVIGCRSAVTIAHASAAIHVVATGFVTRTVGRTWLSW